MNLQINNHKTLTTMETNNRISYVYNPKYNRLTVLYDGKPVGGFAGISAERKFMDLIASDKLISIGVNDMVKKNKVRQLRALWIKQGIDKYREYIIEPFGVSSTADLSEEQLDKLIAHFTHTSKSSNASPEVRAARSVVLKLLMELGIYDNTGDWTRVNAYLMDKRIAGKLLYQMTIEEMKTLTLKLRNILLKNKKINQEINRLSINN